MNWKIKATSALLTIVFVFTLCFINPAPANAQGNYLFWFPRWHPAQGSWFGRAEPIGPCEPGTAGCPLPPELFMVLNISNDGGFIGNDSLTFGAQHTTAHGQWVPVSYTQINANYVVLAGGSAFAGPTPLENGTLGVTTPFIGAFRMRWLANVVDGNNMEGFVNVWFFPFIGSNGLSNIDSTTWVPNPDPLIDVGPFITDQNLANCNPAQGCLGVFKFKIRRVGAQ